MPAARLNKAKRSTLAPSYIPVSKPKFTLAAFALLQHTGRLISIHADYERDIAHLIKYICPEATVHRSSKTRFHLLFENLIDRETAYNIRAFCERNGLQRILLRQTHFAQPRETRFRTVDPEAPGSSPEHPIVVEDEPGDASNPIIVD